MKQTRIIMGMTIVLEIVDSNISDRIFTKIFDFFTKVDERFSPYKETSEIGLINAKKIKPEQYSNELVEILKLAELTKKQTQGYFEVMNREGKFDPSGIVKGWAIYEAAKILWAEGFKNFYLDVGGDIQLSGKNAEGNLWRVGIRSPFNPENDIIKVLTLTDCGIATSGNYARGDHVYNPHKMTEILNDIISLTVIGPNILEADRFATAALAMGMEGVNFIENISGLEAYAINKKGIAIFTSKFNDCVKTN